MDMALPVAAAILWLGGFPPPGTSLLGLFTVFAGYTAVYALNDLADYPTDRANHLAGPEDTSGYLDAVYARHPVAMGLLTLRQGMIWTGAWAAAAFLGASLLNPACAWLLAGGCLLEVVYCRLLNVTHLRSLVNGVVKSLGGVAAVWAVDPGAPAWFPLLFLCMGFTWEIGGQNIPADWFDLEQDRRQGARTLCVELGIRRASAVAAGCLAASAAAVLALFWAAPAGPGFFWAVAASGLSAWLFLPPALALKRAADSGLPGRGESSALFSRASWFPVLLLGLLLVWMAVGR